jgi:hypothetical protein
MKVALTKNHGLKVHLIRSERATLCGVRINRTLNYNERYYDEDDFCTKCLGLEKNGYLNDHRIGSLTKR